MKFKQINEIVGFFAGVATIYLAIRTNVVLLYYVAGALLLVSALPVLAFVFNFVWLRVKTILEDVALVRSIKRLKLLISDYAILVGNTGVDSFEGLLRQPDVSAPINKVLDNAKYKDYLLTILDYSSNYRNPRLCLYEINRAFGLLHYFLAETWHEYSKTIKIQDRYRVQFMELFNTKVAEIETEFKRVKRYQRYPFANDEVKNRTFVDFSYTRFTRI